ncbi:hypothetical protein AB6E39_00130 [Vibrio splendidus]|uniref:hypothetical protein n=1 Tax=Vibrio splendidus TaxID=29497 RepID=UPI001E355A39|nr:hypothetical protein [Vibrio splendidus]MCC4786658.1 hypothetical protein [Vibrio splendidus]
MKRVLRNPTDKYTFGHLGGAPMFHPDGYQIPNEEPVLIFRAKDLGVLSAITAYLDMLIEQEPSGTIKSHLESMIQVTESILAYQTNTSVKSVTCSQKAHKSTIKQLNNDVQEALDNARHALEVIYGAEVAA